MLLVLTDCVLSTAAGDDVILGLRWVTTNAIAMITMVAPSPSRSACRFVILELRWVLFDYSASKCTKDTFDVLVSGF